MLCLSSLSSPASVMSHDLYEVACAKSGTLEFIQNLMSTSTGIRCNSYTSILIRKLHGVLVAEQVVTMLAYLVRVISP
jgi:hypothetical protein